MTDLQISATTRRMGRPKQWGKAVLVKLPEGMPERIDALLEPDEARTDFIRQACEKEIIRRARKRGR